MRDDQTAITFTNGTVVVEDEADISLLRGFEFIVQDDTPVETLQREAGRNANGDLPRGISWYSPTLGVADGYGNSAMDLMASVDPVEPVTVEPGYLTAGDVTIPDILARTRKVADVLVSYCPPSIGAWKRRHSQQSVVGFTMWEDDTVPPIFAEPFREADIIATCSEQNVTMFKEFCDAHGIDVPVRYVPLGVRAERYPYKKRSYQRGNDVFTVLHTSTSMNDERKGAREAYLAFLDAFGDRQDVQLIFRARFGMLTEATHDPRVKFLTGQITDEQKCRILHDAHVYLYPSFGEGFGLMPLEAIASGLPTICSRNTAMLDYEDLFFGVDCDPEPSLISTAFQEKSSGLWMRPRHEQLVSRLRQVEKHYAKATSATAAAAKRVRSEWTYENAAAKLASVVAEVRQEPPQR